MKIKLIVIALMFLAACSRHSKSDLAGIEAKTAVNNTAPSDTPVERHLVKDGSLEFKTGDWQKTKQQLRSICDSLGAYTSDESLSNLSDRVSYNLVIRIPSTRFEELVEQVEKLAVTPENENIKVDDVTREYVDVEVRIKNKKEMEDRYREMLKRATTVDEMLKIERYITEVRTDIERMEAGFKGLQDRIAFSTLDVSFYEVIVTDFGFWSKFAASLSNGWRQLLVVVVGMANIWPFLILVSATAFWIRRRGVFKAEAPGVSKGA